MITPELIGYSLLGLAVLLLTLIIVSAIKSKDKPPE